jgi:hypothetical protein
MLLLLIIVVLPFEIGKAGTKSNRKFADGKPLLGFGNWVSEKNSKEPSCPSKGPRAVLFAGVKSKGKNTLVGKVTPGSERVPGVAALMLMLKFVVV